MEAAQITVDPSKILQVGTGFFGTKTLLTAVNMELFTVLAKRELSGKDIQSRLGLHSRSLYDFLDALVAMDFLKRKGLKESALYSNAEDADFFLDKNKPSYIGGILEMCNNRLYPFWNNLEDGLKTGLPQNETKNGGKPIFEAIYADPKKLREFVRAMAGVQMGN
ncbi:MAG: methyltransferase dimerization domain-containing protein, partial [Arenibacter troitsensis]|nr:methyltransferase dimerization domain-containing protein [Arenibacter troitsensis]